MDDVLKPSLEHMALAKIAVALWNEADVRAATATRLQLSTREERQRVYQEAEEKVMEKVRGLLLPELLKNNLMQFISGIGWEIFKWREHLHHRYRLALNPANKLCWTTHGTMDTKKTAEALIQNENIHIGRRYQLACDYCLEDDIPKLWDKIPENLRQRFCNEREVSYLAVFWSYRMKGQMYKPFHDYQHAFIHAARDYGNKAATEYFLKRLTHEEREQSLVGVAQKMVWTGDSPISSYFPECLVYLISQIDQREHIKVFKYSPHNVLKYLLEWPWQRLFVKTANRMWNILPVRDFHSLLRAIVDRVREGHMDCGYRNLFREFWQQSPNAHKKHVIDKLTTGNSSLLSTLFQLEDKENVRLILKSTTAEERKDILFSPGKWICKYLVGRKKWDILKFFLYQCLSSKETMIEFKEEFEEHIVWKMKQWTGENASKKHQWDKFFQILDDLIQDNNNKRSAQEAGESSSAKRIAVTESQNV